jgi:hypothetical protein
VARLVEDCAAAARAELAGVERGWGVPSVEELTHTTVIHELMVTLGITKPAAERLVELATRLGSGLAGTSAAVEAGRIDLVRARVLSQETRLLDAAGARAVEAPRGTQQHMLTNTLHLSGARYRHFVRP